MRHYSLPGHFWSSALELTCMSNGAWAGGLEAVCMPGRAELPS